MIHNAHSGGSSRQVHLMIWEPRLKDQEIKVNSKVDLSVGDFIRSDDGVNSIVQYEIKEIKNVRASSLHGFKYYTLQAERQSSKTV